MGNGGGPPPKVTEKIGKVERGAPTVHLEGAKKYAIRLQRYPGVVSDQGIAGVPYKVKVTVGGKETAWEGKTTADGTLEAEYAPGGTTVVEVLGTKYTLKPPKELFPGEQMTGMIQRLGILGYSRAVTFRPSAENDQATLDFQADHGLVPEDKGTSKGEDPKLGLTMRTEPETEVKKKLKDLIGG